MAYSSVGRPVFYIDNYLYHKTIGTTMTTIDYDGEFGFITPDNAPDMFTLSPALPKILLDITGEESNIVNVPMTSEFENFDLTGNMKTYIAVLNHNGLSNFGAGYIDPVTTNSYYFNNNENQPNATEVLNASHDGSWYQCKRGSTIVTGSDQIVGAGFLITLFGSTAVGAISTGIQYTMPHSPDLKLSMEIEMDGIQTMKTSGGASFSNVNYSGNPLWVNYGEDVYSEDASRTNCFDVYGSEGLDVTKTGARRNGRRSWNLKFSYISDKDLFSSNLGGSFYSEHGIDGTMSSHYDADDIASDDETMEYSIETDDSFYAQVWNKTLGGALPFIFQPNSNFLDEFYICKFDQNSLKISQSAYKVYDISVKIVETW